MLARQTAARNAKRTDEEVHISSLVVHARSSNVEAVHDAIGRLRGVEIHAVTTEGRMVVTLEAANEADILARIAEIGRLGGVVSIALVFHQAESWQTDTR